MHNFVVHSNESTCRKSGRLGMDQVARSAGRRSRSGRWREKCRNIMGGEQRVDDEGRNDPGEEPWKYRMGFPTAGGPRNCPVEGCLERAATRTAMRVHFFQRHVRDNVIIFKEGNLPHPRCPCYNMLVPWRSLNRRHLATDQCAKGEERKQMWLAEDDLRESLERAF